MIKILKKTIVILLALLFNSCLQSNNSDQKEDNSSYHEKQWYTEGKLHNSLLSEWKNSTEENKLATCGDFMATIDNTVSMDELKRRAINLKNCIDEATSGSKYTDNEKVSLVASMCVKTMGY